MPLRVEPAGPGVMSAQCPDYCRERAPALSQRKSKKCHKPTSGIDSIKFLSRTRRFFLQERLPQRAPPFLGRNRFWTGFWERGHERFSESKVPPTRGRICTHTKLVWRCAQPGTGANLISPEVAEPVGRKLGVTDGVLDVLVAEIVLQGSGIVPVVGKLIAARMPQHVRMQ